MTAEERLLPTCRRTRRNEPDAIVDLLGVYGRDQSVYRRPDREKSILVLAVVLVVDHQVIGFSYEQRFRRLERDPVLGAIRAGLGCVPPDPRIRRLRHWLTRENRHVLSQRSSIVPPRAALDGRR